MQFHEEVYTSAANLLEGRGSANLGVVAKSKGFPREVEADMALLRGYTLLDGLAVDHADKHPPRVTLTTHRGGSSWVCLSRVVFAGADHTGRTAPLAHHMAFEVARLEAARISPAALLAAAEPLFYQRWDGPPAWIEPARTLAHAASPEAAGQFPSAAWDGLANQQCRDALLAVIAQHLVTFAQTKKSVVVCLPIAASMSVSRLMADMLAVLPEELQLRLVCASHVVDPGDAPPDAALVFTYPGTRLLKQAQERRDPRSPVVFDLSGPLPTPSVEGDYASVVASVLRSGKAPAELPMMRDLWRELGMETAQVGQFRQALLLRSRLRKIAGQRELEALEAQLSAVASISPSAAQCVERWSVKYVLRALQPWPPEERRRAMLTVAIDTRWPAALAKEARRMILEQAIDFVPWLLHRVAAGTTEQGSLVPFISELLAEKPAIVGQLINQACSMRASCDKDIALAAIEHCGAVDNSQLQSWLDAALAAEDGTRHEIIAPILSRLASGPPNPAKNAALRSHYRQRPELERRFLNEAYLPLLHDSLQKAKSPGDWRALGSQFVEAALDSGNEAQELAALAAAHRTRLKDDTIDDWRRQAAADSVHGADRSARLDKALEELGLLVQIQPAPIHGSVRAELRSGNRPPPCRPHQEPIGKAPRIISIMLAIMTVALLASPPIWKRLAEHREISWQAIINPAPAHILFWTSISILAAWFIAEITLQFISLELSTAQAVRKVILAAVAIACLLSAYRLGNVIRPDWFKVPQSTASVSTR